jgi:hypothetical protein
MSQNDNTQALAEEHCVQHHHRYRIHGWQPKDNTYTLYIVQSSIIPSWLLYKAACPWRKQKTVYTVQDSPAFILTAFS